MGSVSERIDDTPGAATVAGADVGGDDSEQLIMFLERDQLVVDATRPVPRAPLGRRAELALWSLRIFVTILSAMVIYTFVSQVVH